MRQWVILKCKLEIQTRPWTIMKKARPSLMLCYRKTRVTLSSGGIWRMQNMRWESSPAGWGKRKTPKNISSAALTFVKGSFNGANKYSKAY